MEKEKEKEEKTGCCKEALLMDEFAITFASEEARGKRYNLSFSFHN